MRQESPIFSPVDFRTKFRSRTTDEPLAKDLVTYAAEIVAKHPDVRIHVGTDSQNTARKTVYATAVVFRYGTRGAHIVYIKHRVPKMKDNFTRLWGELERTREVVQYISDNSSLKIHQVDLDYNEDEAEYSSKLIAAGKGLFVGLGYKVGTKPGQLVATRAADHIVRH